MRMTVNTSRWLSDDLRRLDRALWLLVLVGLVIRVAAILVLDDYRSPLTAEYGIVARNLVAGKGFVGGGWLGPEAPTALNTVMYPAFLAVWLELGDPIPYLGVELSQAVLSALLVFLVSKVALRLSDPLTSLLTGILIAFYPSLIYFCIQVSPAILTTFSAIASLYVLLLFAEKPTWGRAAGSGLVFGISLLVEPVLLIAIPGAAFIAFQLWHKANWKASLGKLAVGATLCAFVVLPWTIRNHVVFHRVVLLKTSFGLNLWMGNNPNATGFLYTAAGEPMQNTLPMDMRDHLATLNEAERYAVLGKKAWEWIRSHPQQFLRLTFKRLAYLWWISPTYQATEQNITEPHYFYVLRAIIQAPMLLFGFLGGILAFRKSRPLFLISMWWLLAFTLPYAISVAGNTRYRLPAEPILVILVAFCFAEGTRHWQKTRQVHEEPAQPAVATDESWYDSLSYVTKGFSAIACPKAISRTMKPHNGGL